MTEFVDSKKSMEQRNALYVVWCLGLERRGKRGIWDCLRRIANFCLWYISSCRSSDLYVSESKDFCSCYARPIRLYKFFLWNIFLSSSVLTSQPLQLPWDDTNSAGPRIKSKRISAFRRFGNGRVPSLLDSFPSISLTANYKWQPITVSTHQVYQPKYFPPQGNGSASCLRAYLYALLFHFFLCCQVYRSGGI